MSRARGAITLAVIALGLGACSFGPSHLDQEPEATASPRGTHRSEAARARADAAKANAAAEAELETHPWVRILGSDTQREAVTAQARLEELLVRPATGSSSKPATAKPRQAGPARATANPEKRQTQSKHEAQNRIMVAARIEATDPTPPPTPSGTPLPPSRPAITTPTVEEIVYDAATSIKTVHMSDGSVEETLFDLAELPTNESSASAGNGRITVVNGERTPSTGEAKR